MNFLLKKKKKNIVYLYVFLRIICFIGKPIRDIRISDEKMGMLYEFSADSEGSFNTLFIFIVSYFLSILFFCLNLIFLFSCTL